MSVETPPRLVVPVEGVDQDIAPRATQGLHDGVRLRVRGRTYRLRGIRTPHSGALAVIAVLGPGLIAATAGDDAGGIATYSQVGARYGYDLLWVLSIMTVSLAVIQEMCARLGAATGRGLLDLVRERFGIGWTLFAVIVVLLANGGVIVTEFAGIGAAAELFGLSRYVAIPVAAALMWFLVIQGSYSSVEKVFLVMALVLFAYPIAAIVAKPDWVAVARGAIVPSVHSDPEYIMLLVAMIGTTITPYMQLFQQSSIVEKKVPRRRYGAERVDAYFGAIFSNLVAAFIVIATAATLHVAGVTDIETAADAAQALQPVAGSASVWLFGVGLLGASLLAAGVLPLATAFSVSEAFGFRKGINLDFRRAPMFLGVFTLLIVVGALVAMIPGVPIIDLLVGIQVLNGLLLPIVLVFILLLINDTRLMGPLKNGSLYNVLGWGTTIMVAAAVVVLLGARATGAL